MPENAIKMGEILGNELSNIRSPLIKETRGIGLFRAIEVVHDAHVDGGDLAYSLMKLGLLTKATHNFSVRLAPALVITEKQVIESANIIKEGVAVLEKINNERSAKGEKRYK